MTRKHRIDSPPAPDDVAADLPGDRAADDDATHAARPSKSQRKRDMHALQTLGVALVELPRDALSRVAMPEHLADAVREAQRITDHEGRRRQLQYVGKVMRTLEPAEIATIEATLDARAGKSRAETAKLHAIERWRERLLKDDEALTELLRSAPGADAQQGRTLIRNARREAAAQRAPKYYRELFKWIKNALAVPVDETFELENQADDSL